jgi:hypothetical protein
VLPIVVLVTLGISSTALMLAVLIGLVRSLKVLSGSLTRFRDDVQPLLDDVRKETQRSQDALERISSRRLGPGPGGSIRG